MGHLDAALRILFYCVSLGFAIRHKHWQGYVVSLLLIVGIGASYFTPVVGSPDIQEFIRDITAFAVMHYIIFTSIKEKQ